jgi:hypothetical protein
MKKVGIEFISSLFFSIIGFLLFSGVYTVLEAAKVNINFGGDKGKAIFGLFFGLSIGGTFGVFLIEKVIYKTPGWNILGIFLSILFCTIGCYLGMILLDKLGSIFVLFFPLIAATMCVLGYNIGSLYR